MQDPNYWNSRIFKLSYLENILLILVAIGMLFPLQKNLGLAVILVYNIPLYTLVFLGFIHRVETKNYRFRSLDHWDTSALFIIFALLISTIVSKDFKSSFPQLVQYMNMPLLAIYMRGAYIRKITPPIIIILVFSFVGIECFTSIIQQLTGSNFGNIKAYIGEAEKNQLGSLDMESAFSRIQGTIGNPNSVGALLLTLFPFLMISSQIHEFQNKKGWLLKSALILSTLITIFFTFSRGIIVLLIGIMGLSLPFYLSLKRRLRTAQVHIHYYRTLKIAFFIMLIFTTVIFVARKKETIELAVGYALDRFSETLDSSSKTVSADYRLVMNVAAIKYIFKHPVTGIGFGNGMKIYQEVGYYNSNLLYRPHNTFLLHGVEGGIIAMLAFIWFTSFPLFRLYRLKVHSPFKFAFLFSLLVGLAFTQLYLITVSGDYAPVYFSFLGLSMGYCDSLKNEKT